MYVAVFDVGTSAIKGMLINRQAELMCRRSVEVETHYGLDGEVEQNPLDWWEGIKEITKEWWAAGVTPESIAMVTFTGQMEDCIPIMYAKHPQQRAILYSDTRATKEAGWIAQKLPFIEKITGNTLKASTPVAKLIWLQHHQANQYEKTSQFVFSAKDFVIAQLTDAAVTDPTTGATTGMMDLEQRQWDRNILRSIGIDHDKLPKLIGAGDVVGRITNEASHVTGFCKDMPVLCGSGDAGASTMGAGAVEQGDSYFYIGTTGWAAVVQEKINAYAPIEELFQLAHLPDQTTIAIAPLLNVGNVHQWAVDTFADVNESDTYAAFEQLVRKSPVGSGGILFLPYLHGERFPVHDPDAKGAFWGIGSNTSKSNFARSVIEGISFSLRQLLDILVGETSGAITLIGGGAKSDSWCSILADCLGRPVRVPAESAFMPAIGASSSAFIQLGWARDYHDFVQKFLEDETKKVYEPDVENHWKYQDIYQRYLRMYPVMTGMYKESR